MHGREAHDDAAVRDAPAQCALWPGDDVCGGRHGRRRHLREDLTMTTIATSTAARGGAWLLEETDPSAVFTPEKMTDEHRLMAQMTDEFVTNEILTHLE